jgi:Zn-dependent M28 family amino/carboxypeptidase
MATLVLAMNLAQLFEISSYEKYQYRIRFCWFGAEERGLLG